MEKIILHICCGICASSVAQRLKSQGYEPIGFFYNPNIHPQEEYFKRQGVAKEIARMLNFELIPGSYDKEKWFLNTKGLEDKPEGGGRCLICFKMRLEETQKLARKMKISKFTSTLTVSPHKNSAVINEIGRCLDTDGFITSDFKKQDGFRLAIEYAKRYNLYRQNYCGCIYSKNAKQTV